MAVALDARQFETAKMIVSLAFQNVTDAVIKAAAVQ